MLEQNEHMIQDAYNRHIMQEIKRQWTDIAYVHRSVGAWMS